jgi:hypothetical protein
MSSLLEMMTDLAELLVVEVGIMTLFVCTKDTVSFNNMTSCFKLIEDWFSFLALWEMFSN